MSNTQSTRRMEMALPLIAPLSALMEARRAVRAGEPGAFPRVMAALADVATARTIRQLAAIASATDNELIGAEKDPETLARLEADAAAQPVTEAFGEAMGLFGLALGLSGVTPGFFADALAGVADPTGTKDPAPDSQSGG